MSTIKRIVCLANSRKLSGRCIAGKGPEGGGTWIRPVSAREHEEVSEHERQYQDGSDPKVLDIIDVPLIQHRGHGYQQENWLLDDQFYWVKQGQLDWRGLADLADPPGALWVDGCHTYAGLNDQIPLAAAAALRSSLRLIHVESLEVHVFQHGAAFNNPKRRVQGKFEHGGHRYSLWITDPIVARAYLVRPDGTYHIGESYLTISLGEPFNGHCYKLIAAVIPKDPGGAR